MRKEAKETEEYNSRSSWTIPASHYRRPLASTATPKHVLVHETVAAGCAHATGPNETLLTLQ